MALYEPFIPIKNLSPLKGRHFGSIRRLFLLATSQRKIQLSVVEKVLFEYIKPCGTL